MLLRFLCATGLSCTNKWGRTSRLRASSPRELHVSSLSVRLTTTYMGIERFFSIQTIVAGTSFPASIEFGGDAQEHREYFGIGKNVEFGMKRISTLRTGGTCQHAILAVLIFKCCVSLDVRRRFSLPMPRPSSSCRFCGALSGRRGYTSRFNVLVFFRLSCLRRKKPRQLGRGGAPSVSRVGDLKRNDVLASNYFRAARSRGEFVFDAVGSSKGSLARRVFLYILHDIRC